MRGHVWTWGAQWYTRVCDTAVTCVEPSLPPDRACCAGLAGVLFPPLLEASGGMCTEPIIQDGPWGAGCQINPCTPTALLAEI